MTVQWALSSATPYHKLGLQLGLHFQLGTGLSWEQSSAAAFYIKELCILLTENINGFSIWSPGFNDCSEILISCHHM
jgi:hypothetical protein